MDCGSIRCGFESRLPPITNTNDPAAFRRVIDVIIHMFPVSSLLGYDQSDRSVRTFRRAEAARVTLLVIEYRALAIARHIHGHAIFDTLRTADIERLSYRPPWAHDDAAAASLAFFWIN